MPLPESSTALLVLDFQGGLAEKPFAATALVKATQAVDAARRHGLLVVYSRVGFRAGYPEVASWNPVFGPYAAQNQLPVGASTLAPELAPAAGEPVVEKSRFSPFAGTDLTMLLRAQRISKVAVAGISTSGVVLAAFLHAENEAYTDLTPAGGGSRTPAAQLQHVLEKDWSDHVDDGAAHDPRRVRFVEALLVEVVLAEVLNVAGDGVQAQPAAASAPSANVQTDNRSRIW